ncbi:DNA adenine methylase [Niallia taxi]|uniref:DNA adenine methylase n=1 Tax=Niallia taxi TaxID=2499688 RepID=UPI0021755175|nr:DNA adenine methylase [Niallia taxi]
MLTCQFCGLTGMPNSVEFQLDEHNIGFWCEVCDGFTYLNDNAVRHRFTLILEDKSADKPLATKPDIKLAKRLSPYRYPGGKSRIIDYLYFHLRKTSSKKLVSPFTGGGSFELSMLNSNIVEHLHLNDLDKGVYSLWWLIKTIQKLLLNV